jgi:hypothetical protein
MGKGAQGFPVALIQKWMEVKKLHNTILKKYHNGRMVIVLSDKPFGAKRKSVPCFEEEDAFEILGADNPDAGSAFLEAHASDPEENAQRSLSRTKQTLYDIVHSNDWDLFVTVTFDGQKIDRYDYDEIVQRYSKLLENIKQRKAPNLEYIFVPELHKDGAFHFHGLLRNIDGLQLKYSGRKDSKGNKIFNLSDWNLGFNTATKVTDTAKVSNYLLKYITKDIITTLGESRKRYWSTKGINRMKKDVFNLTAAQQEQFIKLLSENKITVSAKTVNIEKTNYSNQLMYIVLQDGESEQEETA